jgi:oligosaccharide reducing-end xylanase
VATTGWASLAATDQDRRKKFTQAFWDMDIPTSVVFRYYDGLLYMMCLMDASGEYRVIAPKN